MSYYSKIYCIHKNFEAFPTDTGNNCHWKDSVLLTVPKEGACCTIGARGRSTGVGHEVAGQGGIVAKALVMVSAGRDQQGRGSRPRVR